MATTLDLTKSKDLTKQKSNLMEGLSLPNSASQPVLGNIPQRSGKDFYFYFLNSFICYRTYSNKR